MRKILLALALLLAPSGAWAQCNGAFGANTVCGTVAGGVPGPVPFASFSLSLIINSTTISGSSTNYMLYSDGTKLQNEQYVTLGQGGLGGSQSAATANQVPVYPGSSGAAVPTTITPAIIGSLGTGVATALGVNIGTAGSFTPNNTSNIWSGTAQYTGAAITVYANASTGNDSNDCLAATSGGGHGPCLTLQHLADVAMQFNGNGQTITLSTTGTFSSGFFLSGPAGNATYNTLAGGYVFNGNTTTTINEAANSYAILVSGSGTGLTIKGVTITNAAGSDIFAQLNATVLIGPGVTLGSALNAQISEESNASVEGPSNLTIAGTSGQFAALSTNASLTLDGVVITCTGSPAYSIFYFVELGAAITQGNTFSGCGGVTGQQFTAFLGGKIYNASAATIPGDTLGIFNDGGYVSPAPNASSLHFNLELATTVNFNSATTDFPVTLVIPSGFHRYLITGIRIAGASHSLTTATVGLFSGTGGGGTTIIADSAITVSSSAENTNNNAEQISNSTITSQTFNYTTLYIRVGTPEGAAATGIVSVLITFMS